jgi:hypothetical protein
LRAEDFAQHAAKSHGAIRLLQITRAVHAGKTISKLYGCGGASEFRDDQIENGQIGDFALAKAQRLFAIFGG